MTAAQVTTAEVEAGLTALGTAAVLSEPVRRVALRHGLVDLPDRRKAHRRPTPYLGGVAIAAGTLLPFTVLSHEWSTAALVIVAGAIGLSVLGLVDDIITLSPVARLCVQALAALGAVYTGIRMPMFGHTLDGVLTAVWIVLITNAFNLLDNMDGVAAATACVTALCLALSAVAGGRDDLAVLLIALSAACAGFLVHNWAPARIFIGDAGSLFIGFTIATTAAALHTARERAPALAAVLLATFVPTVDTAVVLVSRHLARRPLFRGGTDHVSHRLRRLGLSVPQVGLVLFGLAATTSLAGMLVGRRSLPPLGALIGGALAAVAFAWLMLRIPVYRRRPDPAPPEGRAAGARSGHRDTAV